ncbi:aromatic amino acid aminotransferas-like protein [Dothidotthia symphoricarpi CBS 119687]|uniref:Aromatic amino acid aminotransferas-like protein n=1 Tax=Dothidotthia symphoricarpi CBS 119687 TaxID=1392245 RepID=A0A6A6A271_9PLEO|nr:aromatic amino acid aminotransferas-like protein [Dothidotthia symphoricarpi CBS 119687]KAF2125273.1 aromatic amino acid aminotransferas-like protein [Dothidotthia symphoricarpi CBS 119687]
MASYTTDPGSFPDPVDLTHYLSRSAKAREASSVKKFYKYFQIPGIAQLAGGLPNDHYFPYDTLEAKVANPERWKPTPNKPVDPPADDPPTSQLAKTTISKHKHHDPPSSRLVVPHDSKTPDPLHMIDLKSGLQYGTAQGYTSLYYFIRQFTRENLHPFVPYKEGPEIILTVGSTDGFSKTLQALSNEWSAEHDPVSERPGLLCEQYAYMNAIQTATPRGFNIAAVAIDDEGMLAKGPGGLQDVLENWDFSLGRRPHLMYTVTIGQNPTSGTLSVARRIEIYALCVEYDVVIIEDDPYWYLQYPSSSPSSVAPRVNKTSGFEFLDSLIPSYLSIDYQGRVVRLDTFSKTVAPGCRLGWITAQPALVERILRITETSTQQPSGFVQTMIAELLMGPQSRADPGRGGASDGSGWKVDGWVRWLEGLRGNYERRMQTMCNALDAGTSLVKAGRRKSLVVLDGEDEWAVVEKQPIYSFVRPLGGMFVWVRFDFTSHPLAKQVPAPRLSQALWVFWTQKPYLCLVAPGAMFAATKEIREKDSFNCFRLCFAACPTEDVESISKRFVEGAQTFWRIKKKEKIDKLLEDEEVAGVDHVAGMAVLTGMC